LKKISNIRSALLSPGMQEHIAKHREKSRNTCIKNIQFVYYTIKKRGHIVNPFIEVESTIPYVRIELLAPS
jgi:hypothetical protein